jgi:uncharacterized LabA/DUF88 family protein
LRPPDPDPLAQASRIVKLAHSCLGKGEDLFRIFYYDCPPFGETKPDLLGNPINYRETDEFKYRTNFLTFMASQPFVAVRLGELSYGGWVLRGRKVAQLRRDPANVAISLDDFKAKFQQKGVDMRIGIDIATLSTRRIVDRVILVTADSDFMPAMKLARREGIQVVLAALDNRAKPTLAHHADLYRTPDWRGI